MNNKTFWDYFKINFHWLLTANLIYSFAFLHLLSFFALDFYSKLFYSSFLVSISSFLGIWAIILVMHLINYCIFTPYKPRVVPQIYTKPVEPANVEEVQRMINAQNSRARPSILDVITPRQRPSALTFGENYEGYLRRIREEQNQMRRMQADQNQMRRIADRPRSDFNDTFRLYVEQYNRPSPVVAPQDYVDSLKALESLKSRKNVELEFID